ncbi:MAG: Tagatose-6-phosphate kinase [Luteibacter sp.]|uniref:1-phosphofructokinase family hexose kinase n=1 Tax=Luteibacter sp. TaxID=1886636 RepID=UPI00137C95CD|nr:1-phosphofructokinase family hexose kinase [Luteibacter sp.]KAF1005155.1 MAG: Tagatose-6-phosphate kinase [Luteibacter sp.]
MITVAGFNSAVDRLVDLDALRPGTVQRARDVVARPGGKGVHVAQTIAALGVPCTLVGLCDTANAHWFEEWLAVRGVRFRGVHTTTPLRQCLALREADGRTTEILESGVDPGEDVRLVLDQSLRHWLAEAMALVCTGSLPPGFCTDYYATLARDAVVPCFVDASGAALHAAAAAQPFLLKPNAQEAGELVGRVIDHVEDAAAVVADLGERGVRHPVVTLGGQGAVGADANGVWHARLDVEGVRNAVGSGDCFLAGMVVALLRGEGMDEALRLAVACGAANALGDETGYIRMDTVRELLPRVRLHRIDR